MFRFLRFHLAMLGMLVGLFLNEGGDPGDDKDKPKDPEKKFSQADLDHQIGQRLAREADTVRKSVEADLRKKFEDEQKQKDLQDQQQFKPLYESEQKKTADLDAKVKQLEAHGPRVEALEKVVKDLVADELKGAPDYVADAIANRDPVEQLEYINKHRDKWAGASDVRIPGTRRGNDGGDKNAADTYLDRKYGGLVKTANSN